MGVGGRSPFKREKTRLYCATKFVNFIWAFRKVKQPVFSSQRESQNILYLVLLDIPPFMRCAYMQISTKCNCCCFPGKYMGKRKVTSSSSSSSSSHGRRKHKKALFFSCSQGGGNGGGGRGTFRDRGGIRQR